ncbi:MAG: N-6 DNA methylase [Pirellulales bacterium]|nr:N-6 DNA methylase [Pirellulales bacterium]
MDRRRSSGSYFTPDRLTRWLVRRAVQPAWRAWLRATAAGQRATAPPRIVDPAMGTGHFLAAAQAFIAARLAVLACRCPNHPALRQVGADARTFVLNNCLWGLDSDAVAVAAARVGLWLAAGAPRRAPGLERLRLADALIDPSIAPSDFDVVIGNPPYGKPFDQAYRRAVRNRFTGCRHNADLSVAFVGLARNLARPSGRIGLVLPKPLTYSVAWRQLRREVTPEIVAVCDVECGWREVRLEQVLMVLSPGAKRATYTSVRADHGGFARGPRCATAVAARLDILPVGTRARDWRRFERLRCGSLTIGDICKTARGLPAQSKLRREGNIPVLGGRDLVPFGWRSTTGFLAAADVPPELVNRPRLLFQNIVAHVRRPRPHLRLIGTWHAGGVATLDTVNNLVARRGDVDLWAMLALLHSKLVNWYVYTFVYNRAVRTMHFDQCFLDKIPLPAHLDEHATALAAAARRATAITSAWCDAVGYDRTRPRQPAHRNRATRCEAIEVVNLETELRDIQREIDLLARRAYGLATAD